MIVRIFTDGQYRLPPQAEPRLHELDERAIEASEDGSEPEFLARFAELIDYVHTSGQRLADDELEPSDVILPPADITLAEAQEEFTGEGLIPD